MKIIRDLSELCWELSGWVPYLWQFNTTLEVGAKPDAQVIVPSRVPGSVQGALRDAGHLPDWNIGLNAQACEWVENRHWIYETTLPDDWLSAGQTHRLKCLGLDYSGWVFLNGELCGEFKGTHIPHTFDLTPHLKPNGNVLRIVFDLSPRWLGQFGYSSRMTEWKTRFNYTWDWQPRLVQIGIWDGVALETTNGLEIQSLRCTADIDTEAAAMGVLGVRGVVSAGDDATVRLRLSQNNQTIREEILPVARFNAEGVLWRDLKVELWWPNGEGAQPLYNMQCALFDASGGLLDKRSQRVGFRRIEWRDCQDAPEGADPWVCVVNGRPVFLQGVNFPPLLPNYADAQTEQYRKRLELYRDIGVNCLRLNACGFLEKAVFYDLCDELGLFVWQEFPLTSSGIENFAPATESAICEMSQIARSFIARRAHHASLLLWSGGNELIDLNWHPLNTGHPMLAALKKVVAEDDPSRRFIPTSPSGPRFGADASEFGKGLHHDVHGPWKPPGGTLADCAEYYEKDDALFRSEAGSPGASSCEIIRRYCGDLQPLPISNANPLWRNPVSWWLENTEFAAETGHEPQTLEAYVEWSQSRQAQALVIAARACKSRFPRCGGFLLWTGHDCFPCPTNTSIVDFYGDPKPAALALAEVWKATGNFPKEQQP